MFGFLIGANAQTFNSTEEAYSVLVVNVVKYVQWETIDGDFDIVVLNNTRVAEYMKKHYAGKMISGKKVNVIEDKASRTDFKGIEMVVSTRKSVYQDNLLTFNLGDTKGIINLVPEDDKIRFKIRKFDAQRNKIKISSSLISISKVIDNQPENIVKSDSIQ